MEKLNKTLKNNEKAITLISLVITIIVLLILAGISISMIAGDNSILAKSKEAKEESRGAIVEEQRDLWISEIETSKYLTNNQVESLNELLERMGPNGEKCLTDKEVETIKNTKKVKIGKRVINFDINEYNNENYEVIWNNSHVAYILKNSKELYMLKKEVSEDGYYKFKEDEAELVISNVKKYCYDSIITDDNKLYNIAEENQNLVSSEVKDFWNSENYNAVYVVSTDGNIYRVNDWTLFAYDAENVVKMERKMYLKNDNKLYLISDPSRVIAENVKDFYEGIVYNEYITTNDEVYRFSSDFTTKTLWYDNVKNWYGRSYALRKDNKIYNNLGSVASDVKELYENNYYVTNDNKLYKLNNNGTLITDKFKEWYEDYKGFFVTTDNLLYNIDAPDTEIANVENIKYISRYYNFFINKENKLINLDSTHTVVAENVKKMLDDFYFIDMDNNLYNVSEPTSLIAENVKSFKNNSYTTNNNELYIFTEKTREDIGVS